MVSASACGLLLGPGSGGSSNGNGGSSGGEPAVSSELSPSSPTLTFGNVTVGSPTSQLVTITDVGTANVTISAVSATGSGFTASGGSHVTLTPNQSVTVSVNFDPTVPGGVQGNLSISSNAKNAALQVGLSGTGVSDVVVHKVALNWQPSASAVIGYFVYRGASANGLSKLSGSLDTSTSYTDSSVAAGQTYYYAVTSVDSSKVESTPSTPISVTIPNQ
jgi:Abnormal spindle-like microcephaly-assoc'd, ASPM-SPD-2-Hydin